MAQPIRTECARLTYLGNPRKIGKSRISRWQCRETVAVWPAIVPRGTLMECVIYRLVVGDVNDVHMAKGCRMICAGRPKGSLNREASR